MLSRRVCLYTPPLTKMKRKKNSPVYVGVDAHARQHVLTVIPIDTFQDNNKKWEKAKTYKVKNNQEDYRNIELIISKHTDDVENVKIAIENVGDYSKAIAYFLANRYPQTYYLDPKGIKDLKERLLNIYDKSDTIDCRSIAYLLYLIDIHNLPAPIRTIAPNLELKASVLGALLNQRALYTRLAVRTTHRLRQIMIVIFPEGENESFSRLLRIIAHYPTPIEIKDSGDLSKVKYLNKQYREKFVELAGNTVGIPAESYRAIVKDLVDQRSEAKNKSENIKSVIKEEVLKHPYGEILFSFPHLGEICAATIINIIKDIERWPSKKKFKKILGIYAESTQSGKGNPKIKKGRGGNAKGRGALYFVCAGCIQKISCDNDFKDYYQRQVNRNKPKMKALVSTMGKLAEIIYYCLKNREHYEYQGKYK